MRQMINHNMRRFIVVCTIFSAMELLTACHHNPLTEDQNKEKTSLFILTYGDNYGMCEDAFKGKKVPVKEMEADMQKECDAYARVLVKRATQLKLFSGVTQENFKDPVVWNNFDAFLKGKTLGNEVALSEDFKKTVESAGK